jgi:hypothetical protein
MRKHNETTAKRIYIQPQVISIELDNEISLALESEPPTYESLNGLRASDYFTNDPFKSLIS